jgi:CelD/BcsL family acetyltransferase involved in cellulose biosynthesis
VGPTATTDPSFHDVHVPEEIEELGQEWDALVASGRRPSPFQLSSWVAAWMREFGGEFAPCIRVASRDGRLVGLAPFAVRRGGRVRVAHFVGGHESSLADLVLAPGEPIDTAERLLEALPLAGADALNAYGVPGGSVLARAAGKRLRMIPRVGAPVLEMPDGWDAAYARRVPGPRRSKHRRAEKGLAKEGSLEIVVAQDEAGVAALLDDAFEIHRLRWQGRPDGSTFGRPEKREFMRRALSRLAGEGHYGICLLRLDGRGIAFASWFALDDTFYGHRTAFDPAFARYSPGQIAQRHGIAAASERGARRVEWMGDAEESKLALSDRLDPMHQAVGLARGIEGHLYVAKVIGTIEARKRLKRVDALHRAYRSGALRGKQAA